MSESFSKDFIESLPERERWIYENKDVYDSITRGFEGLARGEGILSKEDFSKYLKDDNE